MRNCAIVCEYDPFHTGHQYQLNKAAEFSDNIFCVMSGNFMQSALPAFCDKSIRAECAVRGGAAAVIELPVIYSTASAQYFAEGAVKIISRIKNIAYIAMGCVGDPSDVLRLADIKINKADMFGNLLKAKLSEGKSYNMANAAAMCEIFSSLYPGKEALAEKLLSDPNNILCIEYICAISAIAPNIEPKLIERKGGTYNDSAVSGEHISATAIRNAFYAQKEDKITSYIPYLYDEIVRFRSKNAPDMESFKKIVLFSIKSLSAEDISILRDCSEGMEHIFTKSDGFATYDELINGAVCRRYGKKRLARLCLDSILGIKKEHLQNNFVTRLLACSKSFDFSLLPQIVKTNNYDIKSAAAQDNDVKQVLEIDERASALYNTVCSRDGGYYNYSLVKV